MSFSKPQVSFSSNFAWLSSVTKCNFCTFLGETLYILHKRDQLKCKFFRFFSAQIEIYKNSKFIWPKNKFFFKFLPHFGVMRHISSILFLAETLLSAKVAYKSTNLVKFHQNSLKAEICTVVGSFSQNHIKFQLKKYRKLSLMTLKSDAKFKEKLTCEFVEFHPTTQEPKSFCPRYMRFELKKYRGVIFHDSEQWCKVWINPDLVVSKMAWGIGWTFNRAPKSLKIVHWWAAFVQSIHCFS